MEGIIHIIASFIIVTLVLWGWMGIFVWIENQFRKEPMGQNKERTVRLTSVVTASFTIVAALFVVDLAFVEYI